MWDWIWNEFLIQVIFSDELSFRISDKVFAKIHIPLVHIRDSSKSECIWHSARNLLQMESAKWLSHRFIHTAFIKKPVFLLKDTSTSYQNQFILKLESPFLNTLYIHVMRLIYHLRESPLYVGCKILRRKHLCRPWPGCTERLMTLPTSRRRNHQMSPKVSGTWILTLMTFIIK